MRLDPDSGREHLAHVAWNAIALLHYANNMNEPFKDAVAGLQELRELTARARKELKERENKG